MRPEDGLRGRRDVHHGAARRQGLPVPLRPPELQRPRGSGEVHARARARRSPTACSSRRRTSRTVYFNAYHSRMRPGSHHMLLYIQNTPVAETRPERRAAAPATQGSRQHATSSARRRRRSTSTATSTAPPRTTALAVADPAAAAGHHAAPLHQRGHQADPPRGLGEHHLRRQVAGDAARRSDLLHRRRHDGRGEGPDDGHPRDGAGPGECRPGLPARLGDAALPHAHDALHDLRDDQRPEAEDPRELPARSTRCRSRRSRPSTAS